MIFDLEAKNILEKLSIENCPVGMGGCKSQGPSYDCCEYDITIFDDKKQKESFLESDGTFYHIYHGTLQETSPDILLQYDGMTILLDEQWELRMLLSKIKEKKEQIFNAYIKNCLVEAGICITKTKNGLNTDPYSSSWLKCAAYFLADAVSVLNFQRPSPVHMLKMLRESNKNKINELISPITESIGIERATPSLLSRMLKSTMGFSDLIEDNSHSKIISQKYRYMIENSLFSDCYFYLGYINKNNFKKIQEVGLKHLKILHLNDSKGELGSHLDRHDHIGLGQIGNAGLSKVIKLMNKNKIPIILETPIDDRRDEFEDIGTAKELA